MTIIITKFMRLSILLTSRLMKACAMNREKRGIARRRVTMGQSHIGHVHVKEAMGGQPQAFAEENTTVDFVFYSEPMSDSICNCEVHWPGIVLEAGWRHEKQVGGIKMLKLRQRPAERILIQNLGKPEGAALFWLHGIESIKGDSM